MARASSGASYITPSGTLRLSPQLEMRFQRGAPAPRSFASGSLPGRTNDFRGSDPARWRIGIPQYDRIRFAQIWRGIDVVYHGAGSRLEYDFVVARGASPERIRLVFHGAESVRLGSGGEMVVRASGHEFCFHPPRILQDGKPVRGGYRLLVGNGVGFQVGRYDHTRALVIDPVLGYAALFGSQGNDPIQSVAVDSAGNVYIAGTTLSEIPLVNPINPKPGAGNCSPTPARTFVQCEDAFVAKFDPTGAKLLYSTYLGGDARDFAAGIAVDRDGNAYVAGTTEPAGFPTGPGQAWVMKLNPSGSALLYNRKIGGVTTATGVAVDTQGNTYVAGTSFAVDFPAVNALQARAPVSSLLVTHDGGATWRPLNNNLGAVTVNSLAIDPTRPATLYAATSSGLYKSLDAGASWTQLLPAAQDASQVVLDPKTPSTLYVLYADSANSQVAKSVDAGATWQVLTGALPPPSFPAPGRQFGALALDPSNSSVVWLTGFANQLPSIYKSVDDGAHWSDVHDFPAFFIGGQGDSISGGDILVDPKNSSRVYVCCANHLAVSLSAVFRTDDGGKTWVEGGQGPTAGSSGIWPPVLDPRDASSLYASWYDGLVRSTDAGQTWSDVKLPFGAPASRYNSGSLAIDPSAVLYLLNETGPLFRSPDGGANWTILQGPWAQGARILSLDPVSPSSTIYVSSPGSGGAAATHAFAAKLSPTGSILWATLIAGSEQDEAHAVAVDSAGNAYVTGTTNSLDFPLVNPVQGTRGKVVGNGFDAFLTKISSDGSKLLYSTYLGGSGDDAANAVAVDSGGNAYIAGSTNWDDFPTVNAIQAAPVSRSGSSFVAKLDPTGRNLLFSTYLSGNGDYPFNDTASSIVVDPQGTAWVAGHTGTYFALVHPIQSSLGPSGAAYIAELASSGKGVALGFSTYLGGSSGDSIAALAMSPTGGIWLAGATFSPDFIGNPGTPPSSAGFLARLDLDTLPAPTPGVPLIRAIYNAASLRLGDVVSPGEIVSLFGVELAPGTDSAAAYPLPPTLQGVSVTIAGITAPLFYVSPGQINFQAPLEMPLGATSLVVKRGSQSSVERPVRVIPFSPGIFTAGSDGFNSPVIVHVSDYSQVTAQNPARAGEFVAIFCTGLGVTGAGVRSGDPGPPGPTPVPLLVEVVVDSGVAGPVLYAGLAPGFAGLYQVNFQVVANATPGTKLLYVSMLGVASNLVPLYVSQ
ncbi:MAG: SBBP repeat-containing protein [Acidobacteriia bacterium]|nr:SBBP repeat-containing protein [Terriglobia bacterium]